MREVRRKEGDDGADTDRRTDRPNTPEQEHGGDGLGFYERLGLHVAGGKIVEHWGHSDDPSAALRPPERS
jgi:hypothetical protein